MVLGVPHRWDTAAPKKHHVKGHIGTDEVGGGVGLGGGGGGLCSKGGGVNLSYGRNKDYHDFALFRSSERGGGVKMNSGWHLSTAWDG